MNYKFIGSHEILHKAMEEGLSLNDAQPHNNATRVIERTSASI